MLNEKTTNNNYKKTEENIWKNCLSQNLKNLADVKADFF